jgi:hypothetical protein
VKPLRLRVGPPVPAAAIAVVVSFVPALYLCAVASGHATFRSFMDGPAWIVVATIPLWLFRRQVNVDGQRLRIRWGIWIPFLFLVPIFWRRFPIDGAAGVDLRKEVRGSHDKAQSTYYVTRIAGHLVAERVTYWPARRDAERVAEALGLPMSDSVDNGAPVTRPATSLSKSLRKRLLDGEVASPDPRRPEWSDLVRREEKGVLAIERPAVRSFSVLYPTAAFYVLLNAVVWLEYTMGGPASKANTIAFFVIAPILGIAGVCAILLAIEEATVQWTVELTDDVVRLRKSSWIVRSSKVLKLAELEEMKVEEGIRLRSDRRQFEFAKDLDPEERQWVGHELLRRMRGA